MYNESSPNKREQDDQLRHDHYIIRKQTKDLRESVERSSPKLANRDQILKLAAEILILVPVNDQELEELDEHDRKVDRGEEELFGGNDPSQEDPSEEEIAKWTRSRERN